MGAGYKAIDWQVFANVDRPFQIVYGDESAYASDFVNSKCDASGEIWGGWSCSCSGL